MALAAAGRSWGGVKTQSASALRLSSKFHSVPHLLAADMESPIDHRFEKWKEARASGNALQGRPSPRQVQTGKAPRTPTSACSFVNRPLPPSPSPPRSSFAAYSRQRHYSPPPPMVYPQQSREEKQYHGDYGRQGYEDVNLSVLRPTSSRRSRMPSNRSERERATPASSQAGSIASTSSLRQSPAVSPSLTPPPTYDHIQSSPRTPPRPPPRPRRSPRRSEVLSQLRPASPDASSYFAHVVEDGSFLSQSTSNHSSTYHSATSSTSSSPTPKRLSAVSSEYSTFRLDRPHAYPEAYVARRQSLDVRESLRFEELINSLPGGWDSVATSAQETGPEEKNGGDPEDWARQRRMSSLISGLGIVFGSAGVSDTVEEEREEESDLLQEYDHPVLELLASPMQEEASKFVMEEPTTPESGSSDCFESAEEGDDETSASPYGRRIRSRSRASASSTDNKPFQPSGLSTIVDNSPVIGNLDAFRASYPTSPPPTGKESPSVAFGYARGGSPRSDEKDPLTSVRQLVRESWRLSKSSSQELSSTYEKRLSQRALERLSLEEEIFDLQVADAPSPQKSSYTPSPRPLLTAGLPLAISLIASPSTLTPSQIPLPPSAPLTPAGMSTPSSTIDIHVREGYFDDAVPTSRYATKVTVAGSTDTLNVEKASRRRSVSHDPSAESSPALSETRSGVKSNSTPTTTSSPVFARPSPVPSPTEAKLRRRMSLDGPRLEGPRRREGTLANLVHSKPTRRLSTMFTIGRSRQNSKDGDNPSSSGEATPVKLRRRGEAATPSPRASLSPRSSFNTPSPTITPSFTPTFASPSGASTAASSPADTSSPMAGASPSANPTWRSSMSTQEYEKLLARYGRMELKRQEVIWELCETEKSFVTGLCGVIRVFTLPLRTPTGTWIKGIPVAVSRLLDWLDDIVYLHSQISNALQATRQPDYPVISKIADAFLPFVARLEVHQPYLVRFEAVTKAIDEMTADAANDFGEFVRIQSALPECGSLPLSSFLLKPVQRLMKYPLFFKQLCDLTPPTHPDHIGILSLLHSTDSMIRVMQEVKIREEEYEESKILESCIRGLPAGFKLSSRDRRLVAHGLLKRVHINDKDRTVLEMDAMARSAASRPIKTRHHQSPQAGQFEPNGNATRRSSTISDSSSLQSGHGDSSETGGSSTGSWTSPTTPDSVQFDSTLRPDSLRLGNFGQNLLRPDSMISNASSATGDEFSSASRTTRVVKTKAKETSIHCFVFSDLVVLATKSNEGQSAGSRFARGTGVRRIDGPSYKLVESIGLSRVLGVSDLSGKTEHDHLLEVDLLPMPTGESSLSLSLTSATSATSIYLTLSPPRRSPSSPDHHQLKERQRWLSAFQRSYLFALRSLSFPSLLNATTAPVTTNERLSCASFLEAGIIPKSPSLQFLDNIVEVPAVEEDGLQQEREERAWWAVRLKQVRKELESELRDGSHLQGAQGRLNLGTGAGREKKVRKSKSLGLGLGLGL